MHLWADQKLTGLQRKKHRVLQSKHYEQWERYQSREKTEAAPQIVFQAVWANLHTVIILAPKELKAFTVF